MKLKNVVYGLVISSLLVIGTVSAQIMYNSNDDEPKSRDEQKLDSLKNVSKESKERAKDANDAAVQSKKAVNSEKKAQKARVKADEQDRKANESKEKSDSNY